MLEFRYKKKIDKMSESEVAANVAKLKEEIAKLEEDLASFDGQIAGLEKRHRTSIDEARAYLEDDKVIVADEIKHKRQQAQELKEKIEDINGHLSAEKAKVNTTKNEITTKAEKELAKINKDNEKTIIDLKRGYDEMSNDLKTAYDTEEKKITENAKVTLMTIEDNLKRLNDEFKKIEDEIKAEQAQMIDDYNRLIDEESVKKDALTNKSSSIRTNQRTKEEAIETRLKELTNKNEMAITKSKDDLDGEYLKMKVEFDSELERQKNELLELTKRKTELTSAYNSARSDFEKAKESLIKKYDQENEVIQLENKQLEESKKKADDELLSLKDILAKKENELASYKLNSQKELDDLNSALEAKKQEVIAKHEASKASEESTLKQALEEMRERYAEMKDSLVIDKESEISRLNADYRMNQRRYLSKTKDIRAHYDALKGEYQDKLTSLRKANMILQDEIDADMQKHEIKMMSLNQKMTDEDLNFKRLLAKLKEEYDAKIESIKAATIEHRKAFEKEKEALNGENDALAKELEIRDLYYAKELAKYEMQLASIAKAKDTRAKNHQEVLDEIQSEIAMTKQKIETAEEDVKNEAIKLVKRKEDAKREHDETLARLEQEHQKRIDSLNASFEDERLRIERDLSEKISARDEVFNSVLADHQKRLEEKDAEFAIEKDRLTSEKEAISAKFESEYQELLKVNDAKKAQLQDLKAAQAAKISELDQKIVDLTSDYDQKVKALKDDFITSTEALKDEETKDRQAQEEALKELTSSLEEKRLALVRMNSDFEAKIRAKKEDIAKAEHEKTLQDGEHAQMIDSKKAEKEAIAQELEATYQKVEQTSDEKNHEFEEYRDELLNEQKAQKVAYTQEIQNLIAANNDTRFALMKENEKKCLEHQSALDQKEEDLKIAYQAKQAKVDADIKKLNDENDDLQNSLKARLFDIKRLNSDLDRQYSDLDRRLSAEINELKMAYTARHQELDENYLNTKRRYQSELADLRSAKADRIKELVAHNATIQKDINKLDEDQRLAQASFAKDLEDLQNALDIKKHQIEKSKDAYASELDDCERLISALKADYSTKIDSVYKVIEDLQRKREDFESEHKRALKKAKATHDENIQKARLDHEAKIKQLNDSLDALIMKIYDQENVIKNAYQNKVDDLMADFEKTKLTIEKRRTSLKNDYDALILVEEKRNADRQADLEKLDGDLNRELAIKRDDLKALDDEYREKVAALIQNEEAKIESYRKECDERIKKLDDEREELTKKAKSINDDIIKAKADYDAKKEDLLKSGEKFKAHYRKVLDEYVSVIESAKGKRSFFKH